MGKAQHLRTAESSHLGCLGQRSQLLFHQNHCEVQEQTEADQHRLQPCFQGNRATSVAIELGFLQAISSVLLPP